MVEISVIVPARNEEKNISYILEDLSEQTCRNFEVIVIDDHSDDNTVKKVKDLQNFLKYPIRLIRLSDPAIFGKKMAITAGVNEAKGETIVITDADCRVKKEWLAEVSNKYRDFSYKMVFGRVIYTNAKTAIEKLQEIEFNCLMQLAKIFLKLGVPTMCSAANMSFKKKVFNEVNGYEGNLKIASGDDEFLLHKIHKKYPKSIGYINSEEVIVATEPKRNFRELLNQRTRWVCKWKHYKDTKVKLLIIIAVILNLFVYLMPIMAFLNKAIFFTEIVIIILISVLILELLRKSKNLRNSIYIPLFVFIYPLFIITTIVNSFFKKPNWKGRKIKV